MLRAAALLALPLTLGAVEATHAAGGIAGAPATDPSEAIIQADAAIRAEIAKSALVSKAVKEGLEANRQEQAARERVMKSQQLARQTNLMCQMLDTQDAVRKAESEARAAVPGAQRRVLRAVASTPSTVQSVEASHALTSERFCSEVEASLGICSAPTDPRYAGLAGADQEALYLFQARDGSDSYTGGRGGAQYEAVESYIKRAVVGIPPQNLHGFDAAAYASNSQARAYVELKRRYAAFLSMASYSLNRIKESRNPLK